jgi:hypothetical protein
MKIDMKNIYFFCIFTTILFSCKKDNGTADQPNNYSITGVAQKGPFPQGSKVTVYELNNKLEQTGKVFITETSDDFGAFSLKDMLLTSSIIQVEVEGNPYNEALPGGQGVSFISGDDVAISNIVDLKKGTTVNINLLSDLSRQRMKYLIQNGTGFDNARAQAEREVMKIFGLDSFYTAGSEKMDITQQGDASGSLLAMSAIFLTARDQQWNMILQTYIAKVRSDLETDGVLSDTALSNSIKIALIDIQSESIRTKLSTYYKKDIPSFAKYVNIAKTKLGVTNYSVNDVTFPAESGNILAMTGDTISLTDTTGMLKIKFPSDAYKKIRVSINGGSNLLASCSSDWTIITNTIGIFVIEANVMGKPEQINLTNWGDIKGKGLFDVTVDDLSQTPNKTVVRKWIEYK